MKSISFLIASFIVFCLSLFKWQVDAQLTQQCLDCICQASTGCDLRKKCHNAGPGAYFCGPYQISWAYWADGGKPGDTGGAADFERCLNSKQCAEQAIIGYMQKWQRDCNGDGVIDCLDYAAIHKTGANGCNANWIFNTQYWASFQQTTCYRSGGGSPAINIQPNRQPENDFSTSIGRAPLNPVSWTTKPPSVSRPNRPVSIQPPPSNTFGSFGQPYNPFLSAGNPSANGRPSFAEVDESGILKPIPPIFANFDNAGNNNPSRSSGNEDAGLPPVQPTINTRPPRPVDSNPPIRTVTNANAISISSVVPSSCLECICQASSDCDLSKKCDGNFCGPYLISWPYWADGGKPGGDYATCAVDKTCSEGAVRGYMNKWQRDCNGDRVIDCDDFAAIHKLGPHQCDSEVLFGTKYWISYESCSAPPIDVRSLNPVSTRRQPAQPAIQPVQPRQPELPAAIQPVSRALERTPHPSNSFENFANLPRIPSTTQAPFINRPTRFTSHISTASFPSFPDNIPARHDGELDHITENRPPGTTPSSLDTSSTAVLDKDCLDCICMASSQCDTTSRCTRSDASSCGPFRINWSYWSDAGRPGGDFLSCMNSKDCTEGTIQNYMTKWSKDCNSDGALDCYDFASIHKAGPSSCSKQWFLESQYWSDFRSCFDFRRRK